ncbi:rRNA-processing protein las1 [Spiromyces aspiralis]|uniref:rRNA-processing protein las1 n=1 Tax=Spiromyces aspiralis TaxID=68401 RepID=A0ACC1HS47_9FUNG|nr:rRNA-processing protein las1 [Spiromyces aspiralis]
MALTRFVNAIVDQEQQGYFAQSIASKAEQIGMPSWLVDLRHASTHEALPAVSVLRTASRQALDWLYANYWQIQLDIHNEAYITNLSAELRPLLERYVSQRRQYLELKAKAKQAPTKHWTRKAQKGAAPTEVSVEGPTEAEHVPPSLSKPDHRKSLRTLRSVMSLIHQDLVPTLLIPMLLEPGFIVPTEKKLRSKYPDCKLAPDTMMIWKQAFREFESAWGPGGFVQELLHRIILAFNPNTSSQAIVNPKSGMVSSSYASTLVAWVRWILEQYYSGSDSYADAVDIDQLLETCLRNPGIYSRAILQIICEFDAGLAPDLKPFIDYMAKRITMMNSYKSIEASKTKPAYTPSTDGELESIERRYSTILSEYCQHSNVENVDLAHISRYPPAFMPSSYASNFVDVSATNQNSRECLPRWQIAGPPWKPCPIGTLPDGRFPKLDV